MLELIKKIIFGHVCKFEVIRTVKIVGIGSTNNKAIIGRDYTLQCSKCGNLKFEKQRF